MTKINAFIIIIVLIHFANNVKADQSLQCGDWVAFKDEKCFKVLDKELQIYSDAKHTCYQNEGSSLMTISSNEEQNFLFDLIHNVNKNEDDVWIGGQLKEKEFKWSDNATVNFTNWANDNPTNVSGYECVEMSMVEPNSGKWFNEPCSRRNLVVCQKTQNWLFGYLQKTVIDLRKSFENVTNHLENTNKDLENKQRDSNDRIKQLENTIKNLQSQIEKTTPTGTVAYFANTTAPLGWLKANGQLVLRTEYASLFASIGTTFGSGDGSTTFTLPDLRGEFIRGWSDDRDVDKNRTFGSFQWGSTVPLVGYIANSNANVLANAYQREWNFAGVTYDDGFEYDIKPGETRDGVTFMKRDQVVYSVGEHGGNITTWNAYKGTRPRNIALLVCIKY